MKGALMSFWSLSVTVGNLWVLLVNAAVKNDAVTAAIQSTGFGVTAFQMFFFAGFAFAAAAAFGLYAYRYTVVDGPTHRSMAARTTTSTSAHYRITESSSARHSRSAIMQQRTSKA
jgi:hypothetical protein